MSASDQPESGKLVPVRLFNQGARSVASRGQGRSGEVRVPRTGKMRIILNVHGGQQGLADVIEGLVRRNMRAIRDGAAPTFDLRHHKLDKGAAAWKDAPLASREGYVSGKTAAAWHAASLRLRGKEARVGFREGHPAVFVLRNGEPQLVKEFGGPPVKGLGLTEGRTDERMVLVIDDDKALPVREVNDAIARHNARRIREKNLPPLYRSGVRYQSEGSPELWWDAEEILRNGHDDCEGLAAYRAGELINRGYDARVYTRLVQMPSKEMGGSGKGGRLFHAVTGIYGPDGEIRRDERGVQMIDDPSHRLGMPTPDWYAKFARDARARGKDLG